MRYGTFFKMKKKVSFWIKFCFKIHKKLLISWQSCWNFVYKHMLFFFLFFFFFFLSFFSYYYYFPLFIFWFRMCTWMTIPHASTIQLQTTFNQFRYWFILSSFNTCSLSLKYLWKFLVIYNIGLSPSLRCLLLHQS